MRRIWIGPLPEMMRTCDTIPPRSKLTRLLLYIQPMKADRGQIKTCPSESMHRIDFVPWCAICSVISVGVVCIAGSKLQRLATIEHGEQPRTQVLPRACHNFARVHNKVKHVRRSELSQSHTLPINALNMRSIFQRMERLGQDSAYASPLE